MRDLLLDSTVYEKRAFQKSVGMSFRGDAGTFAFRAAQVISEDRCFAMILSRVFEPRQFGRELDHDESTTEDDSTKLIRGFWYAVSCSSRGLGFIADTCVSLRFVIHDDGAQRSLSVVLQMERKFNFDDDAVSVMRVMVRSLLRFAEELVNRPKGVLLDLDTSEVRLRVEQATETETESHLSDEDAGSPTMSPARSNPHSRSQSISAISHPPV